MKTINDFYYVEVYFLDENGAEIASICIKTKIPPLEFNDDCEIRLKSFLSEDLKILGATNIFVISRRNWRRIVMIVLTLTIGRCLNKNIF